jgi:hypothetical protein
VFEKLKGRIERNRKLTSWHYFFLGALGKTIATICTYPYLVVKSRLQAASKSTETYQGTTDVLLKIWQQDGTSFNSSFHLMLNDFNEITASKNYCQFVSDFNEILSKLPETTLKLRRIYCVGSL